MGFKHTGLFPEQAVNWDWMINKIKSEKREIKVLNLNCNSLVEERKNVIEDIVLWVTNSKREEVIRKLQSWETSNEFPIFYSTLQYILRNV